MIFRVTFLASAWMSLAPWICFSAAQNYNYTEQQQQNARRNLSIGYVSGVLFPYFTTIT